MTSVHDSNAGDVYEEGAAPTIRRVVIDPEGDVVLNLAEAELQVSSRALSLGSKVFKALFSPRFSEGLALSRGQGRPIELDDDDTAAMTTLCQVLHHTYRKIHRDVSAESLADLALVADKYDCVEAISQYSSCCLSEWLRPEHNDQFVSAPPYGRLIYPALTFDDAYMFQQITKRAVYQKNGLGHHKAHSIKQFGIPRDICALLPVGLLELVLEKELTIKGDLLKGLENLIHDSVAQKGLNPQLSQVDQWQKLEKHQGTEISLCDCLRVTDFLSTLAQCGVWPIAAAMMDLRLGIVINVLKGFQFGQVSGNIPTVDHPDHMYPLPCVLCKANFTKRVMFMREHAERAFSGFCLDCVKWGGRLGTPEKCRMADACHAKLTDD